MNVGTDFVDVLVEFGDELRNAGVVVGTNDTMTYVEAVSLINPADLIDVYWAGRGTLVNRKDQIPVYNRIFQKFFLDVEVAADSELKSMMRATTALSATLEVPSPDPGKGEESKEEEAQLGYMASGAQVWRNKAFAACTDQELATIRRIVSDIRLTPPRRRTRRTLSSKNGPRLDPRRMALETMRSHGDPIKLFKQQRRLRIRPLVFILDVSGSMSDYSRNLLQFAYSARRAADKVEVFCFGTRLTRITKSLDRRKPDDALNLAAAAVFDWDGGTRIGESLSQFIKRWGRRGLSRGSIVVICSDGLDRGDPELLESAMEKLSRLCHRIVWMNPHKGNETNFKPNSLGMMVADPFIDEIFSGHNLASLEQFAENLRQLR
ncbi:MAG: vWA domain-containing protein [Ilumatobacteraceae bacterium]